MILKRKSTRATILVVDDDERFTDMMEQSLTQLNYAGATCNDPVEALNLFSRMPERFDVAVVDENMPNMRGRDLAIALLRIKDDLPVILVSEQAAPSPETVREAGMRAVLVKPVLKEELRTTLDKVLRLKRAKNNRSD